MNKITAMNGAPASGEALDTPQRGKLGWLMRAAKPALEAACAEIDAGFIGGDDTNLEPRVLRKLDAYRAWILEHGLRPPVTNNSVAANHVLRYIGHPKATRTDAIRTAIRGLEDLLPDAGEAFRGSDADPVDLLIGIHVAEMREREYGLPRNGPSGRYSWRSAAKDIGCKPKDLNEKRKAYLRAVDKEIGVPGISVDLPKSHWDKTARNPAVPALLAAEFKRRRGEMPADPLHPTMLDAVEIAEGAGVTARDITGGPLAAQHREAMEEARDGKPLVPNPFLAARRFTYRDMKEWGRTARQAEAKEAGYADPLQAGSATVMALTRFLTLARLGGKVGDTVPLDFPDRVRRAIASRPDGFGSGWETQIKRWIGYFDAMRSDRPLPTTFATAIKVLAAEANVSAYQIIKAAGARANAWLHGLSYPTVESDVHVRALEALLRVKPDTLSRLLKSEWRSSRLAVNLGEHGLSGVSRALPADITTKSPEEQLAIAKAKWERHVRQETEYAKRLSSQIRDRYRLPFNEWPKAMQDAWKDQTPELNVVRPYREADLRLPGARPTKAERSNASKDEDRSWRPLTERMGERMCGYFFGFLVRPRVEEADSSKGSAADPNGFSVELGLDMPLDLIHPVIFVVLDLLTGFAHWKKRRSGGRFAPTVAQTLQHAADFLKPGSGIVWKNEYKKELRTIKEWLDAGGAKLDQGEVFLDIDAFEEDWQAAVTAAHAYLLEDIEEMKPGDPKRKKLRQPFVPIRGYLDEHDPMVPYMADVRRMLEARPLGMVDRHLHGRNAILTLIVVQTGLRAATLLLTVSGEEPTLRREKLKNGTVRWRILIPASRFKNFSSPFFADDQPYDFVLDDECDLYGRLDEYMARGRPYLLKGRASDALFIGVGGKDLTAAGLSNVYRTLTGMHFVRNSDADSGTEKVLPHGLHAVRHIIATSLLRTTGDIYVAAWAIQDTARTVEQHYVDFLPKNKVALAIEHLRRSRAAPALAHAA
ncbi:hypothetical protein GGQ80_002973 [Sphingomonas jinjuensis]|uniref:Uncharacterized protein n=1 Tax=Sphingomonas jinjuensis TaxID=535907 RepID=A0A840FFT2_9SPHN|nr:hypothetical protein [Sphingomonas jinjuensis]MBB4155056.1 hypothetical protein [Sphingomonas jinjuensis]